MRRFGIKADDFAYAGILKLFKERVQPDLEEAARCTRLARSAGTEADEKEGDDPKRTALFRDGSKLKELIELYEKKIKKNFGPIVDAATFKAAKASLAALDKDARQGSFDLLWGIFKPHLPLYGFALLLMIFDSSVGAATWHGISSLLDGVADGSMSLAELRAVLAQTYFVFILCIFSHLTSWAFTHKCTGRFSNSVRSRVLRGVLRQDTFFFDVYPSGVIQERINNDASELAGKLFQLPLRFTHCIFMIISNSIAVYAIEPKLLLITIAPIPVVALIQRYFIKVMDKMHSRSRKVAEHCVANTNEMIKELRTVRSFAMEEEEAENYEVSVAYKTGIEEWASVVFHCAFIAPLVMMFIATRLLATYAGGTFVASKLITVGMAVQVGMAADHLQHCFREILDMIPEFVKVLQPVGRVCDSINTRGRIEPYPGGPEKLSIGIKGSIEFRDVDFTFPSEPQKQILHKLNFVAEAGAKVAFVGATGCGKSTSIQIIQRFYAQSSGAVLLDGRPIEDYDVHHLRRAISVVAQDNVLFSTTIRENITYGLPREERNRISDEQVIDACKKANAWSFINDFPRALETYCGERGVKLSGGQKQRLAIARAIIRKPNIVLLDEATSALDSKSEEVVQAALDQMITDNASGCTIMIAHRLSTVKNCDTILCMDKGHVVEQGSHDKLLEIAVVKDKEGKTTAGLYRDLWETQMGTKDKESDKKKIEALMIQLEDLRWQLAAARGETKKVTHLKSVIAAVKLAAPKRLKSGSADKENDDDDSESSGAMLAPARGNSNEAPVSPTR